jgi:hypothetical protein
MNGHQLLTFLSNYFEMYYLKIYIELFELEILSRGLTQMYTLTNKNTQITELNKNKNKLLDRGEKIEYSEIYFLYNSTYFIKCSLLSFLFLHYTTPLFIVFGVINAHAILYNQSNSSYSSYTSALIV